MNWEAALTLLAILVVVLVGFVLVPRLISPSPRRDQWEEKRREARIGLGLSLLGTVLGCVLGVFLAVGAESRQKERTEREELAPAISAAVTAVSYEQQNVHTLISAMEQYAGSRRYLDVNLVEIPRALDVLAYNPLFARYAGRGAYEVYTLTSWMKGSLFGATHPALPDSVRLERLKEYAVSLESTLLILTETERYVMKEITLHSFWARVNAIREAEKQKLPESHRPPITAPWVGAMK